MEKKSTTLLDYFLAALLLMLQGLLIWLVDTTVTAGYIDTGRYDIHAWTWITVLLCLMFDTYLIHVKKRRKQAARKVVERSGSDMRQVGDKKYERMGGWLSFFVFGQLGIVPFYTMGVVLLFFAVPAEARTDGDLASLIAYLVIVVFGVTVAVMFLKRKAMAASFAKLFCVGVIGLNAANIIIHEDATRSVVGIMSATLWLLYFDWSKRVKVWLSTDKDSVILSSTDEGIVPERHLESKLIKNSIAAENRNLCPACFMPLDGAASCTACAYPEHDNSPVTLPLATVLNDNYVVGRFLGRLGGFGITYLGYDMDLSMRVAIKEYFPRDLVGRRTDGATIQPHSAEDDATFAEGIAKFLEEARMLALFDHPNVVRVRSFFKQHGTAYIVMDYYNGQNLEEYVQSRGGRLKVIEAITLLMPVLDGLREVHNKGILHRDIKPQNIYITTEGRVILLDFGAARVTTRDRTRSTQVTYTPGFAPLEQAAGNSEQGPWTDLYSTAAVFWFMMTGQSPQRVEQRLVRDELLQRITTSVRHPHMRDLLLQSLAIDPNSRMRSISQFQQRLLELRNTI